MHQHNKVFGNVCRIIMYRGEASEIEYKATTQREVIILFIFLTLLILTQGWAYIWLRALCLFMLVFHLAALFINYSFLIKDNQVIYTILFLNYPIYKKQVNPSHIKKVVFKRTNWTTKLAVIQLHKGFSVRICYFKPASIFHELMTFCETHHIQYEKTRDYAILEKLK